MGRARHLVRRFVTTLRGRAPSEIDMRWVHSMLDGEEVALFLAMTPTDQAHSIEVARRAVAAHHDGLDAAIEDLAGAGLLHDVGKADAEAGVVLRVVSTLIGPVVSDDRALGWAARGGVSARLGRQLSYPALGAERLAAAGSRQLFVQWAAEHHLPESRWTIPAPVGRILQQADNASS